MRVAALVAALATASPAAAEVRSIAGHRAGVLPAAGSSVEAVGARHATKRAAAPFGTPPLEYWGGGVVHAMSVRPVYWLPSDWSFPEGFVAGFDGFLTNLAAADGEGDNVTAVAHEYVDAEGPALGSLGYESPVEDANSLPNSGCPPEAGASVCLTDAQITEELGTLLARGTIAGGLEHSYVVATPPGVEVCFDASGTSCSGNLFCGYHSAYDDLSGIRVTYTVLPFPGSGCESGGEATPADSAARIEAHELIETATDPEPGSGYVDGAGLEIADECAWTWGETHETPEGLVFNQVLDGEPYLLQEMYSDQTPGCVQELLAPATVAVTPNRPTVPAGSPVTLEASLQGDGFPTAATSWRCSTSGGSFWPCGAGATTTLAFAVAGDVTVWAVVTDSNGGTVTGVTDIHVSRPAPSPPGNAQNPPGNAPKAGAAPAAVRRVHVTESRHRHRYTLTIRGSGFVPGMVILTVRAAHHNRHYRVGVTATGTFSFRLLYGMRMRYIGVRSA